MKPKQFWVAAVPSLILSVIILFLYPFYLTPLYQSEIIKGAQKNSKTISNYFIERYLYEDIDVLNTSLFSEKENSILKDLKIFNIWKIRFFNSKGVIVYSSIKDEINTINQKTFFVEKIAKGETLSKIAKKGGETFSHDKAVPYDVVETYIPIMKANHFIGAFEIYLNVTEQLQRLHNIFYKSYIFLLMIIIPLVVLVVFFSNKIDKASYEMEIANKELERMLNVDGLTQLYNRRYFDDQLLKEINRLQRTSTVLSLLMCDIDYFKKYNDTYGHLAGDDCIRSVAGLIRSQCKRVSDIPARYGGEEFCVILPNTGSEQALFIAESLRKNLTDEKIPHSESPINGIITISIGLTTLIPDKNTSPEMIISLADKALYASKNNGRNRVTLK